MGLDMYLTKKTYVRNWDHFTPEDRWEITVKKGGNSYNSFQPDRAYEITELIGQWRKVNAIHNWFVINVQDGKDECQESYVSVENLSLLLGRINRVLENHELAPQLLPSQPGFFFGSTDYDEWYFKDLEYTKTVLETAINEGDSEASFYYRASW